MGYFEDYAVKYHELGFNVTPASQSKAGVDKWGKLKEVRQTSEDLEKTIQEFPNANIALVLGGATRLIAIDIDSLDPKEVEHIRGNLPPSEYVKFGSKGCTLFYKIPFGQSYQNYKNQGVVEVLSTGSITLVPPGDFYVDHKTINSKGETVYNRTFHSYKWESRSLLDIMDFSDIPELPKNSYEFIKGYSKKPALNKTSVNRVDSENRNNKLTDMCQAGFHKNKTNDEIVKELIAYDLQKHTVPFFTDTKESCNGSDPYTNATRFIASQRQTYVESCLSQGKKPFNPFTTASSLEEDDESFYPEYSISKDFKNKVFEPKKFLIPNLLTEKGMTIFAGNPKDGKSTFAKNVAVHVSNGSHFLGGDIKKGSILHFALEEDREDIERDYQKMGVGDTVMVFSALSNEKRTKDQTLKFMIKKFQPSLLILDPLELALEIKDMNCADQIYPAFKFYKELISKNTMHILFIHHSNKGDPNTKMDKMMGSKILQAVTDLNVIFERKKSFTLLTNKGRFSQIKQSIKLKFNEETLLYSEVDDKNKPKDKNKELDLSSYVDDRFIVLAERVYKIIENEKEIGKTALFNQARVSRQHFDIVINALLDNEIINFKEKLKGNIKTTFLHTNKK